MRNKTLAIVCFLGLLPIYLALAGCNGLENAYKTIELGKPLDMSVIPKTAVIRMLPRMPLRPDDGNVILLQEQRKFFPFLLGWEEVQIVSDQDGNVVRLSNTRRMYGYWILFFTYSDFARERFIDSEGKPQERETRNQFFPTFPFPDSFAFVVACSASCIGWFNPPSDLAEPEQPVRPPGAPPGEPAKQSGPTTAPAP